MTGFKIWLLILNIVAFMSTLGYSTAKNDYYEYYKSAWLMTIGFATGIAVFIIICSMLPVK